MVKKGLTQLAGRKPPGLEVRSLVVNVAGMIAITIPTIFVEIRIAQYMFSGQFTGRV